MFKSMKLFIAGLMALAFSMFGAPVFAAGPDLSSVTSAVDFGTVTAAILGDGDHADYPQSGEHVFCLVAAVTGEIEVARGTVDRAAPEREEKRNSGEHYIERVLREKPAQEKPSDEHEPV